MGELPYIVAGLLIGLAVVLLFVEDTPVNRWLIIICLGLGSLLLFNLKAFAQPNTPFDLDIKNYQSVTTSVNTFTVTTKEGTYRIFTYHGYHAGGITAVKIK